jgi:hypothetical protein
MSLISQTLLIYFFCLENPDNYLGVQGFDLKVQSKIFGHYVLLCIYSTAAVTANKKC